MSNKDLKPYFEAVEKRRDEIVNTDKNFRYLQGNAPSSFILLAPAFGKVAELASKGNFENLTDREQRLLVGALITLGAHTAHWASLYAANRGIRLEPEEEEKESETLLDFLREIQPLTHRVRVGPSTVVLEFPGGNNSSCSIKGLQESNPLDEGLVLACLACALDTEGVDFDLKRHDFANGDKFHATFEDTRGAIQSFSASLSGKTRVLALAKLLFAYLKEKLRQEDVKRS